MSLPDTMSSRINDQDLFQTSAENVEEALSNLLNDYSELRDIIYDESQNIRRFINIFVDGVNIKDTEGILTEIKLNAEITILAAIAGG
tara:strand:- start:214 stop:477 length:264 start_codon:yes stop_codon:yes gene_type:complete